MEEVHLEALQKRQDEAFGLTRASLFKAFLSPAEIDAALQRLAGEGTVAMGNSGRDAMVWLA